MDTKLTTKKIGIFIILLMSFISFVVSISTVYAANNSLITSDKLPMDIRFVVDVSGSMNANDPKKIRVRSLQKIIKSLPEGSKSGVWTYAKYVNNLVPVRIVSNSWKKETIYRLDKIGGYGNYRNLGEAIDKASTSWKQGNDLKKYIVVLTSGDLRVSSEKTKNAKAKLNLLTGTLAKLKNSNVEVHTVSIGDKADHRLLKVLAKHTNGNWYKISNSDKIAKVISHVYSVIASKYEHELKNQVAAKDIVNKNITKKLVKINNSNFDPKKVIKTASNTKDGKYNIKPSKAVNGQNKIKKVNSNKKPENLKRKSNQTPKDKNQLKNKDEMDFNWPTIYSG